MFFYFEIWGSATLFTYSFLCVICIKPGGVLVFEIEVGYHPCKKKKKKNHVGRIRVVFSGPRNEKNKNQISFLDSYKNLLIHEISISNLEKNRKFEVYPEVPQRTWKIWTSDRNYPNWRLMARKCIWDVDIFLKVQLSELWNLVYVATWAC